MAPIILGNPAGVGNIDNIIVPYKDQYRVSGHGGGVAIGNTADTRVFSTGTVIMAGTNLTISTSAVGALQYLNLSIADPAAAANYVFGGDYVSLSTAGVGTTVSVTGLQPVGAYLTTAALTDHNHGGAAFATGNIGGTIGSYTATSATGTFYGWSLSIPDFLITAALSDHSHSNYAGLGVSTGTTTGVNVKATLDTNGLSLRTPNYLSTAAQISHTHGIAAGTNITIGSSSNGLALSVGNYITTAAQISHIHGSISTISTSGTAISYTSASNGLTLGIPAWITTAAGGNNLTLGGNTAGTLTEMNSGTVSIVGGNNITLSQDGNAFTIIGAASGTDAGIALSVDGTNTLGTLNLISSGTLNIQGGNNITLSQSSNTVYIVGGAGNVGTGFTSNSISGSDIKGSLGTDGLSLIVPPYLLASNTSNFAGVGSSIIGGSMTYNTLGLTLDIPIASATASNAVFAGNNISLSTNGVSTTVSVIGVLGTEAANSFVNTAFSTLLQHVSDNSLSVAVSQSSLFQLVSDNSLSLGTGYTSHTHSNLYIALSESSLYRTSVLSNSFAVTSHTHSNLYLPISASSGYQTSVLSNSFLTTGYTSHTHPYAGTNTAITGGSLTVNTSGISVNVQQRSMSFSDANNIVFGGSVDGYSTTITASANLSNLSNSYALTNHTHSQYVNTSISSQWLTTAMLSNYTSAFEYTSHTSAITSNAVNTSQMGAVYFADSLNTNATWTSTYSGNSTYLGVSANGGTGAGANGTLEFINTNGVSFISASSGSTTSISASVETAYIPLANSTSFVNITETGNIYFSNGSNLTFSSSTDTGNNTTVFMTAGGGTATGGGGAVSASNGSFTFNTLSLGNSNGLTFYTSNSSILGSYTVPTQGTLSLINANGVSFISASSGSTTSISASIETAYIPLGNSTKFPQVWQLAGNTAGTSSSGNFYSNSILRIAGGNNITLSASSDGVISIIGAAGGTGGGGTSIVPGNYLSSSLDGSTLSLSVTGLQATSATSAITANAINTSVSSLFQYLSNSSLSLGNAYSTHTHNYQSTGAYLTTAAVSNHSHGNPTLALTNLSGTTASNSTGFTLSLSAPAIGGAQTAISGIGVSNTTYTSGTIIYSNQSNITIGSSVNGASQYIRLSVADAIPLANSTQYATSILDDTFLTTGYTSHTHNYQSTANYLTTAAQVSHSHGGITINGTNISNSVTSASNGLTINLSVAAPGAAQENNYINLYGNTSNSSTASGSSILLSAGNNITLAVSGGSIKIQGAAGGGGVAIANSNSTVTNDTLVFSNSNGVAFGLNGSTMTMSYTTPPLGTLSFINTNGISFITSSAGSTTSISASVDTAYVPLANSTKFAQVWKLSGNTAGTSSSSFGSELKLNAGTNITLSGGSNGISIIGGGGAGGGVAFGDGAATITSGTALLSDANNVSFGINGQTVTASIPAFIGTGISTSGNITVTANTAGLSMTAPTLGYLYFSNTNGHSWSSSTSGVSTSIWIYTA